MRRTIGLVLVVFLIAPAVTQAQRYTTSDGRLRVALAQQRFSRTGISSGPNTMASGDIQQILEDMDVLDPREVMGHVNRVPNGPSSEQLAKLFEAIFARYPKASAIGFATIPTTDEGGLSIAALNRMIAGVIRGVKAREQQRH
jgi:hypothetical protein